MNYGSTKTIYPIDESGSTIVRVETYWRGSVTKVHMQYRIRVKVYSAKEELTEYLKFTDEIANRRKDGTLAYDRDDMSSRPSFIIEYPKENVDGGYFIIKSYTVLSN
jgi:hypothetical protein